MMPIRILFVLAALAAICAACTATSRTTGATDATRFLVKPTLRGNRRIGEVRVGRGIACWVDGTIGTASYAAGDSGSSGTPKLDRSDAGMLRKITRYVRSRFLRFAYVGGEFVVFDATDGPCSGGEYYVLNAWGENYSPTDNLGYTTPIGLSEGTFKSSPRPWMTNPLH